MKNTDNDKKKIPASNLKRLRTANGFSQEQVAEKLNVSRQAVAKWESGESLPDIFNCRALADLYDITVDDLFNAVMTGEKKSFRPKGKHIFGAVRVGKDGNIKLPEKALAIFGIKAGSMLLVLGDESQGLALCKPSFFLGAVKSLKDSGLADEEINEIINEDF